jgi:hypothetical protein
MCSVVDSALCFGVKGRGFKPDRPDVCAFSFFGLNEANSCFKHEHTSFTHVRLLGYASKSPLTNVISAPMHIGSAPSSRQAMAISRGGWDSSCSLGEIGPGLDGRVIDVKVL